MRTEMQIEVMYLTPEAMSSYKNTRISHLFPRFIFVVKYSLIRVYTFINKTRCLAWVTYNASNQFNIYILKYQSVYDSYQPSS